MFNANAGHTAQTGQQLHHVDCFFEYNKQHTNNCHLLYHQFLEHYFYQAGQNRVWEPQKKVVYLVACIIAYY